MDSAPAPGFDAVVPAGGHALRFGSDKLSAIVGCKSLLDRALDALAEANRIIVVGPERPTGRPVRWTAESPPGGGPAAAVSAGLRLVRSPIVVLLAGDLPFATTAAVAVLVARVRAGEAGCVLLDDDGREQWLFSAWASSALHTAPLSPGGSLVAALRPLQPAAVRADGRTTLDCDTAADLDRARAMMGQ